MMGKVICLIEDKIPDKDDIICLLQQKMPQNLQNELSFDWLEGDGNRRDAYHFYTESILQKIEEKKSELEAAGDSMGILLDLILTEEEFDNAGNSYFLKIDLAKKIYFQYRDAIPIYIVTVINSFGAQCDVIMGEDLSDRYVTKRALLRYKMENSINDLFKYYKNEFRIQG